MLVFDLGGGTFDVTIMVVSYTTDGSPNIVVRNTGGIGDLGGGDFDHKLLDYVLEEILKFRLSNSVNL